MDQKPKHNGRGKPKGNSQPPRMEGARPRYLGPPMALNPLAPSWPRQPAQVPKINNQTRGPGPVKNHQSQSQAVKDITRGISNLPGAVGNAPTPIGRSKVRGCQVLNTTENYYRAPRPESSQSGKMGTSGQPIDLMVNFFPITSYTNWTLYQYRVNFSPEEEKMSTKRGLLARHRTTLGPYIFDGTMLFSSRKFDSNKFTLASNREEDNKIVIISIFFTSVILPNDYAYIQVFNLLVRSCLRHLNLTLVGRNYYDPKARINIPNHKLELWPGYEATIGMYDNGLLMKTEISTKVMRNETVYDFFLDCMKNHRANFMDVFKVGVIGTIVLTQYNSQTYRIDDVDHEMTPLDKFKMKDGTQMSYVDYYKKKWNINIKIKNQPLLVSKIKKSMIINYKDIEVLCLIPELCSMTGISESMRSNFQLMKDIAEFTRVDPMNRIKKYNNFLNRLQSTPDSVSTLKNWNLNLGNELVRFKGRVLNQQKIYANIKAYECDSEGDWSRHVRSLPMYTSVVLQHWVVLYPQQNEREVKDFIGTIRKVAKIMGFNIPPPVFHPVNTRHISNYSTAIEQVINELNPPFIMCVTLSLRSDVYNLIKRHLCVTRAVPSQVVLLKNVLKNNISVSTKIAIQINCKLGGAPWKISVPTPGIMIAGFDVFHDKERRNKSFGALIASINDDHTKYFSSVLPHPSGEELANNFCIQIAGALNSYRKFNKKLPDMIIIYRDGVGDGQISYVHETEVKLVKNACKAFYNSVPPMAFIIVKKRIGTRIFSAPQENSASNPPAGTVVDSIITDPTMYDFFLVSQFVKSGTASPTHYNIIVDTLPNWSPNKMHLLTYKLCHMYFNWSGTVRVPAHCQLAHKLAFLTGQSLQSHPNIALNELLYFL